MEQLTKEYVELLNGEGNASNKFGEAGKADQRRQTQAGRSFAFGLQ